MIKAVFDTNVLLDYFGVTANKSQQQAATDAIAAMESGVYK